MADGKGLAAQWGVDSPSTGGESSQQKAAFAASYSSAMGAADGSLGYTATNAETAKHEPLVGDQEGFYGQYQQVLGQIDPADESKAAGAIDSLLAAVRAFVATAAEVKKQVETDLNNWNNKAADLEKANGQIDELDQWGIDEIADLLAGRGEIDGEALAKRWKEATERLATLVQKLGPLYDEYQRQKAAKEEYEPERERFDGEFAEVENYPEANEEIQDRSRGIRESLGEIDGKAAEKDFVACKGLLQQLRDLLSELQDMVADQQAAMVEYTMRLPGVLPRDYEAPESKQGTRGWQYQNDMVNLETDMTAKADSKDYVGALALLDQLQPMNDEARAYFAELEEKKRAYEVKKDELLSRATEASQEVPERLQPDYQEIDELFPQADGAADGENYDEAMTLLGNLESRLATFEIKMEQHRQDKATFEAEWGPLLNEMTPTTSAVPPECDAAMEPFNAVLQQIMDAQQAENFGEGLSLFGKMREEHQRLVELVAQHQAYQDKLDAVLPRATDASADLPAHLEPEYQKVDSLLGQAEQAAQAMDFRAALNHLGQAESELQAFEAKLEQHRADKATFEAEWGPLLNEMTPTTSALPPGCDAAMEPFNAVLQQIMDAQQAEKFGEGLSLFGKMREEHQRLVELVAQHQAYQDKLDAVLPRATDASADLPAHLEPEYQKVDSLLGQAEQAAQARDFGAALNHLGQAESELQAFEAKLEQHRADKATFEAEWGPLLNEMTPTTSAVPPGCDAAMEPFNAVLQQIMDAQQAGKFGEALSLFGKMKEEHQKLVELVAQHQAYQDKLDAVLPRATDASADLPAHLEPEYQKVDSLLGQAEQAAQAMDFGAALNHLGQAESELQAFEAKLEQHRADKATFEAEWGKLLNEMTPTTQGVPPELESDMVPFNAVLEQIMAAEQAGNYTLALSLFASMKAAHATLKQKVDDHKAKETQFEESKQQVEGEIEAINAEVPDALQDDKGTVDSTKSAADAAGAAGDFDQGQAKMDEAAQQAEELKTEVDEQEAAKTDYEASLKAFEAKCAAIAYPHDYPMLNEGQEAIDKRKGEAVAAAAGGDFVTALDAMTRASAMLEGHAKELPVYQKQEADYLAKSPDIKQQVVEAGKDLPNDESAKSYYKSLQDAIGIMEGEAASRDFAQALGTITQLVNGLATLATFKEKEDQKEEEYNQLAGKLEGPVAEATKSPDKNYALSTIQANLTKRQTAMLAAAGAKDFDTALEKAREQEAALVGYQTHKDDVEAERETYTTRLAVLEESLAKTEPTIPGELAKSLVESIGRNKATMEGHAAEDNFDDALQGMDVIETSLSGYNKLLEEHEKLMTEYETRSGGITDGLAEVAKPVSHMALKEPRSRIFGKQEAMQSAAGSQDYAAAIVALDWLEPAVADYLTLQNAMENAEEEYKKRYGPLVSRLNAAADSAAYPEAEEPQQAIASDRATMEASAAGEDFETALGQVVVLAADVGAYEALLERLEQQEEDFTTRWGALKDPVAAAIQSAEKNIGVVAIQERLGPRRDTVQEAEQNRAFETGLAALTDLEATFEGFKTMKADVEEERQTYEGRLATISEGLKTTEPPLEGEMAAGIIASIGRNKTTMEAAAGEDDFDQALRLADIIDTSLAAYSELLEQDEELEVKYTTGAAALDTKLGGLDYPSHYPVLKPVEDSIKSKIGEMKASAGAKNFEEALDKMNRATAMVDGYATELAAEQKQEADYKTGHGAIKPRLQAVAKAKPSDPKAQGLLKSITSGYKAMKDLAAKHQYREALSYLTQLDGSLATLESFLSKEDVAATA